MIGKMCEMLAIKDGRQVVACHVTLANGKIEIAAAPGYQALATNLLSESKQMDAAKWFYTLPKQYSGTYLRAKIV